MAKRSNAANRRQAPASGDVSCPVCRGTGWETFLSPVPIYNGEQVEYAKPCSRCCGAVLRADLTLVPPQFRDADLSKFNFDAYSVDLSGIKKVAYSMLDDFRKWEIAGKGLYLWSKTSGSGKTYLACCLAKSLMIKYNLQMRFVTAPDYIDAVGASYKRESGETDMSEVYRTCKLLVLDDIGAQSSGEWQQQEIFRLLNKRLEGGNITIFTANMSPERLNLEGRCVGRITKASVTLQMPEESIRSKMAVTEQNQFLKDIMQ